MNWTARRALEALVVAIALFSGVLPARAGDDKDDLAFKKYEMKVVKLADEIQEKVAAMRGLKYQAPVPKAVATEEEVKKALLAEFEKPENRKDMDTKGRMAKAFGFIPKDFDYSKEMRELLDDQIAGFYDPEAKRLRLVKKDMGLGDSEQEMMEVNTMAHELEHALQDQNFDLKRWDAILGEHTDRSQAFRCVVEGEATSVGFKFQFEKMGMPYPGMKQLMSLEKMAKDMPGLGGGNKKIAEMQKKLESLPPYLVANLGTAYEEGAIFVEAVFDKGGWNAVSELFHDPPASTAQILHPKKFFEHVEPREISMPSLHKIFDATLVDENTQGEFNVRVLLETLGAKKKAARTIASGWAGDRYNLFEKNGTLVLAWLTTWEDETKAQAFEEAYRAALEKQGNPFSLERRATEVLLVQAADKEIRGKVAEKAWLSAFDTGHIKPFPSMRTKPPASDFTNPEMANAFGSSGTAALGETVKEEELGLSLRLPQGYAKGDETIQQIKDFSKGYWKGKTAELRLIDLPMPFDKETLLTQFEQFVKKGTKDFKKSKDTALTVGGHDAFQLDFEGVVPDGTEERREARAVAVERDGMTLVYIVTAKKGGLASELPSFDASVGSLRFVPGKLPKETTLSRGDLSFTTSQEFEQGSSDADGPAEFGTKDGAASMKLIVARARHSDIDQDRKETDAARARSLPGYRSLGTSTFQHDALGMVYTSDYEVDAKSGHKRVHELVALSGDKRIQLTCTTTPDAYDKWRPAFERAVWTLKVKGGTPPAPEKKKPEKKPAADNDEPF